MKRILKIVLHAILISVIGVFGVDFFSHLFFSKPMETTAYFIAKTIWFFVFSSLALSIINFKKHELKKVIITGIIIATTWGAYYNVLPALFDYYPLGISLKGLTFLGMGLIGTGIAFGIVHSLAFIVGYYLGKLITENFINKKNLPKK